MDQGPGRSSDRRARRVERAESSAMSGSSATTVSSLNTNANNVNGQIGALLNYNSVTNNIVTRPMANASDAIQIKIATFLNSRHVARAVYGAQIEDGCMKDTRVQVLRDIDAWIKDLKGPQIFWLAGMAGTGKSAIAWTVCSRANGDLEIILGGSFFCSRSTGVSGQRDVRCVVPTLALLMARQSVKFAETLAAELALDPDVLHQQVRVQVEKLLYKPLLALKDSLVPILFVIDAIDECGGQLTENGALDDAETHRIVSDMLEALVTFSESAVKLPVKFFVTSRPETHIRDTHVSDDAFSKVLRLHTVDKEQVTADIRLYIYNRLFATSTLRGLFTENDVNRLVDLCNGLFIVAATALGHTLGAGIELARARFNSLLNASRDSLSIGATEPLDRMYAVIVEDAAKVGDVETNQLTTLLRILAAVLSARMTLSFAALEDLLDMPSGQLRAAMTRLHAVIHIPDDDGDASLRPVHASFGDYLFGRASSRIRISEFLGHETLAYGCLQVLAKRLHFNVSQSLSSSEPNSALRPNSIMLSLEYACLQWIYHISTLLEVSKIDTSSKNTLRLRFLSWTQRSSHRTSLEKKIGTIFRPRLLFWLEVMSVLDQVQRAAAMLMFAATTVRDKEIARFLRDANSFVASSHQAISRSAPHIYISALPFADTESLVYQDFVPLCIGLISVGLIGVSHHAGRLLMTLTGHEGPVNSIAYSSDGLLLASGSADGTVRIWDMRTGEEVMIPLRSGDGIIWSVSISPDHKSVVSGTEGGVVCIWSLADPHIAAQRLSGHSSAVSTVLYSPNGSYLASGSLDNTVCLWNAETYQRLAVLKGHTDKVHSIAFSPDGLTLATGSEDRMIRLWDVATGRMRRKFPSCHNEPVYSLCFLPDGQKIAVGSGGDIILCDVQTGKNFASVHSGSNPVISVNLSPDGLSLVSSYGKSVCLSSLPRLFAKRSSVVLEGHTKTARTATFSHNGLYIASGSDDHTIRIWNASARLKVQPTATNKLTDNKTASALVMPDSRTLTGHTDDVKSVAVSLDNAVIVSGSNDRSVRVWDAHTGGARLPPLLGHTSLVRSVAISSDGRLIVSGSGDHTARLWELQTGKAVGEPMQGHSDDVRAVVFSPDAQWLVSGSDDKTVRIWSVATQQPSIVGPLCCDNWVSTVAVSPDGRLVTAGDQGGYINFWQSDTGQPARTPLQTNMSDVCSIGFSPDGTQIVAGGQHGTSRVWIYNISTGERVFTLTGHTTDVNSVTYSPDGRLIMTGSYDMTVRIWDALTGAPIALLAGHRGMVWSVAFTPDIHSVVSGSSDNTIRVWDGTRAIIACPASDGDREVVTPMRVIILDDGWLQAPSGELLLWVPAEYRLYLHADREPPRVVVLFDKHGWHRGQSWASCWRVDKSDPRSRAV